MNWHGAPTGTKSFAVTVYDPDAPTGSGWWHWVVYNIPATARGLPEAAGSPDGEGLPAGSVQMRNDFGAAAYSGACPPPGAKPHRYVFTVHALKIEKRDVPTDTGTPALVGYLVGANRLAAASFTIKFGRK